MDLERHDYLSTACFHDQHEQCRRVCKFCPSECSCGCHDQAAEEPKVPGLARRSSLKGQAIPRRNASRGRS